ncbi:hypothetical protein [Enemella dayhoffiae]|uniref:hypothetical protein n=1 Tax=Enemella dayhoffiae TaxID=2016507 RepID=UPI000B97287C|nr:hypothetical protein [Enemella dayhoffiae]
MAAITVLGDSLAGMAVAARLAKVGHRVVLVPSTGSGTGKGGSGSAIAELPAVFTFPAPWRDLFKKSGRILEAELTRRGLALTPVPARRVAGIELPAERGAQWRTLSEAFGEPVAARWRDLLDALDEVWQARRPLGLERELDPVLWKKSRRQLWTTRTVDDLARRFDHPVLSQVIRESAEGDPRRSPATEAMWLSVERTFGLWQVTDDSGTPVGTSALVDALADRLEQRGVTSASTPPGHADATIVATGSIPRGLRGPKPWWRRTGSRLEPGRYTCGAHTAAGRTMAGQLLSAALAAYAVHADLTGEDIHPTNKNLTVHRRR